MFCCVMKYVFTPKKKEKKADRGFTMFGINYRVYDSTSWYRSSLRFDFDQRDNPSTKLYALRNPKAVENEFPVGCRKLFNNCRKIFYIHPEQICEFKYLQHQRNMHLRATQCSEVNLLYLNADLILSKSELLWGFLIRENAFY